LQEGIISKLGNKIILTDFSKLLNRWAGTRKLPKPIYFKTLSVEKIETKLKISNLNYALTLFSAAWHRIKFFKIEKIEVYIRKNDLNRFRKLFGKEDIFGNVEVYVDDDVFIGKEKIKGLYLVSLVQNYVDLMSIGGNGTRVAIQLAKKYEMI
jgi:virulence-associated protein VapD